MMKFSPPPRPFPSGHVVGRWRLGRLLRGIAITTATAGLVAAAVAGWSYRQSRQVPEFYARAIASKEKAVQRSSTSRRIDPIRRVAGRTGRWRVAMDNAEINDWLADELPRRFERLFHKGVSAPVVSVDDGALRAAVHYRSASGRIDAIVSCRLEASMTQQPNLLAVRLSELKLGALPIPIEPFIRRISREAAGGDLDIRWDFTEQGPVALVDVPKTHPQYAVAPVVVEKVELVDGRLHVAGHSGDLATAGYRPSGPVHHFVSFRPPRPAHGAMAAGRCQDGQSNVIRSRSRPLVR